MGAFFPKPENQPEEIFTDDELDYLCVSEIYKQKINGKEYYIIIHLEDNMVIEVDENKMVYEIRHSPTKIRFINKKLIDYLKENYEL